MWNGVAKMADDRYEQLNALRERAKEGRDPTAADETLALLCDLVQKLQPERVLEIGAGEGLTSIALRGKILRTSVLPTA